VNQSEKAFRSPVGTHDVLPPESTKWQETIALFSDVASRSGFGLIVNPLFEDVGVFQRGIGENSDVARKEMYTFTDRSDRVYALRPEGTASVVRSFVQHHPTTPWKVWYFTPAFRYERPQAGRYRQHHQLGVEAIGTADPFIDVEVIAVAWDFFRELGLREIDLRINSMGHDECRALYVDALLQFLSASADRLCDEHRESFRSNTLRVLDCKKTECESVTTGGPQLPEYLCAECTEHFSVVTDGLTALGIPWTRDVRLVRGFDYYTRTTFEFSSRALDSAQNAVGGGGRYDRLVENLGGDPTPAIGFGSGIERLLLALQAEDGARTGTPSCQVFIVDTLKSLDAMLLASEIRSLGVSVERAYDGRSMKSQMKLADRSGAVLAILIGEQEVNAGEITVRRLKGAADEDRQFRIARAGSAQVIMDLLQEMAEQ